VNDKVKKPSPVRPKKVDGRTAGLSEGLTLRELRRARKITQVRLAKVLGITQDSVSRLERRSDVLLSTLRKAVKAMGGNLKLMVEFPDRAPVVLSGVPARTTKRTQTTDYADSLDAQNEAKRPITNRTQIRVRLASSGA
jgi:transcriptional regulator with XRE-family HTH domain